MSGGVGPSSDIHLPNPKEEEHDEPHKRSHLNITSKAPENATKSFFTLRQMNVLAVIVVLSASGMVSIEDAAFVVFSFIYVYFISKVAFPLPPNYSAGAVFGENNRILSIYVLVGAVIGLFIPIAYIFEGALEGDKQGIKAAAPHLFLLASQILMEGVTFQGGFTLPVRVFVPVFYNSRRIFTLVEWLRHEIYKGDLEFSGGSRRLFVGRVLAVANMAFWCFNLFGFLLPVYLPKAFKMHFKAIKD